MKEFEKPIVLDLGKQKKKNIKDLKQGQGKLVHQVMEALGEVESGLGEQAQGKVILPVVVLYKEKRKRTLLGI